MNYNEQSGYRYNNQYPWEFINHEPAYILAENGSYRDANTRPYKCWIPSLMGDPQTPIPTIDPYSLSDSIYCNDPKCKIAVSSTIGVKNYIDVGAGDHTFFYHRWLRHGAKVWVSATNDDIDEIVMLTKEDPSYCNSCLIEHPSCNGTHPCIKN